MSNLTIPSLSTNGNIQDVSLSMKKLFEYFLLADYSQTFFYINQIASFKYIINDYKDDDDLTTKLTIALTTMFERYFDDVEVEVFLKDNTEVEGGNDIIFTIVVDTNGIKTDLSETIVIKDSDILFNNTFINELYNLKI